jgi:hypothetical protein
MWSQINNNFICSEKEILRVNKIHLEKLLNTKSDINNKGPEIPFFMKNKSNLREIIRTERFKRNKDNYLMYKKLLSTAATPSPYSKCYKPKYCPAFDKQRFNFDKIEREYNIYNDNVSFFKRFSARKSLYSAKKFLKKNDYENYIKNNISKSKFLPQIPLRLVTFRQFRKNLIKESNKIREIIQIFIRSKKLNGNKALYPIKSNSMNNLLTKKSIREKEDLKNRSSDYNSRLYLNNINNFGVKDLYFLNNKYNINPQNKKFFIRRSKSALNITNKNNKDFNS